MNPLSFQDNAATSTSRWKEILKRYISSVVTDGMFNETRWRTATSFFSSQKNVTRAVRIFCNVSLVALSIFNERYVCSRLDASFSSIHLANPILILYDAVLLDNLVRFKAFQSFDNSFAISVIYPARANERFFSAQYQKTTASWFSALSATNIFRVGRGTSLVELRNSVLIPYGWWVFDGALGRL